MRPMLDRQVYSRNAELITAMLDAAGITWWWVDPIGHRGRRVIACHHRDALLVREALVQGSQSSDNPASWRITNALARRSHTPVTSVPEWADLLTADDMAWRVGEVLVFEGTGRELGLGHGCDLEFWRTDPHGRAIAPRENRAARILDEESSRLVVSERDGRTVRLPAAFDQTFIDDVTFPIDAVYTWVDGDDPHGGLAAHPSCRQAPEPSITPKLPTKPDSVPAMSCGIRFAPSTTSHRGFVAYSS